jgi:hypothetical protein
MVRSEMDTERHEFGSEVSALISITRNQTVPKSDFEIDKILNSLFKKIFIYEINL